MSAPTNLKHPTFLQGGWTRNRHWAECGRYRFQLTSSLLGARFRRVTRHIVLLFDERLDWPGLLLIGEELERTLRSNSTEPMGESGAVPPQKVSEVYRKKVVFGWRPKAWVSDCPARVTLSSHTTG
jgi:hypothetical protein